MDHLYSEIEAFQQLRLSAEESFLISQKRFGAADVINVEFQKAKPWARFMGFLIPSIVAVLGIKLMFILVKIISFSLSILLTNFSGIDLQNYFTWGDLGVQVISLMTAVAIALIVIQKTIEGTAKHLWLIPIAFLLSEIISIVMMTVWILPSMSPSLLGMQALNAQYIYIGSAVVGAIGACWILVKNRELTVQLV